MKKELNKYKPLTTFIKQNPNFEIHDNILFCNSCNEVKDYKPKEGVRDLRRHLKTLKHIEMSRKGLNQKRLDAKKIDPEVNKKFYQNLINAMISANIPIHKLENA